MIFIEMLGWTAMIVSSVIPLPQAYRIYKDKAARDVSLMTMVVALISQALWYAYASAEGYQIIALASFPPSIIIIFELWMYHKYK